MGRGGRSVRRASRRRVARGSARTDPTSSPGSRGTHRVGGRPPDAVLVELDGATQPLLPWHARGEPEQLAAPRRVEGTPRLPVRLRRVPADLAGEACKL